LGRRAPSIPAPPHPCLNAHAQQSKPRKNSLLRKRIIKWKGGFVSQLNILQKNGDPARSPRWWEPEANGRVHCYLCPRHCHINPGQAGFCFIRINEGGKLYSLGYGAPAAVASRSHRKKALNHFLPGTRVFSMGTAAAIWAASSARTGTFQIPP